MRSEGKNLGVKVRLERVRAVLIVPVFISIETLIACNLLTYLQEIRLDGNEARCISQD